MARLKHLDDSKMIEVFLVNSYAAFMGYLSMAVKGLGFLVLTWTTVVLLGGFVSVLPQKDFWSLALITLIQTTSAVDGVLMLREVHTSTLKGLQVFVFSSLYSTLDNIWKVLSVWSIAKAFCSWLVQLLVFTTALLPLAVILKLGLYISAGLSLWRLIEHDYGNTDGGPNFKLALDVAYTFAVAQGLLHGYRFIRSFQLTTMRLAEDLAEFYSIDKYTVRDYIEETIRGCTNDPSFARGRNLITYAMDLMMDLRSQDRYISGVRTLGSLMGRDDKAILEQMVLIKQVLTGSTSFLYMVDKLLETLGPRSPYSSEIREHAGRIVAHVAGEIRLEQLPRGLQCISSLLDTFQEYTWLPEGYKQDARLPEEYERAWLLEKYELEIYERDQKQEEPTVSATSMDDVDRNRLLGYKGLVVQGLRILQKLAIDEDNCRVISNTNGLLPRVMALLTSEDQLHRCYHDEWCSMAEESLGLISRLMAAPGDTGVKLSHEISRYSTAVISTLGSILECCKCELLLKRRAVEVVLYLPVDTSFILAIGSSSSSSDRVFMWILLHIFLLGDNSFDKMCGSTHWMEKKSYIRKVAGEKLHAMLPMQSNGDVRTMVESVVGGLTRAIVDAESYKYRVYAAQIMESLCVNYSNDGLYIEELKKATANVMPEVLKETVSLWLEIHGSKNEFSAPSTDLEKGEGSQDNAQGYERHKLLQALLSFCQKVCETWVDKDPDLARQFNEIVEKIYGEQRNSYKTFSSLVYSLCSIERAKEFINLIETKVQDLESAQASSQAKTLLIK